jgi:hypothetical protein
MEIQKEKQGITICVDFDGTCVTHKYPKIGKDIGAIPVLRKLAGNGHKLILFTMRSGLQLDEAIEWFSTNNIPLYAAQYNPTQKEWTSSNKCYAQLYIDDAALGCPLKTEVMKNSRPYVDWNVVEHLLKEQGILKP